MEADRCVKCNVSKKKVSGFKRIVSDGLASKIKQYCDGNISVGEIWRKDIVVGSVICSKCFTAFKLNESSKQKQENMEVQAECEGPNFSQSTTESVPSTQSSGSDPSVVIHQVKKKEVETVELDYPRTVRSNHYCFMCGSKRNLKLVPDKARYQVFAHRQLIIPKGKIFDIPITLNNLW